ncbi:hypothetical protein [Streptomyces sp. WMMC905]|uniref:hypothetical protein n=1 Tax=Streptomyces sp. WMMC905 TaxID=3404123 RepID=UPI003B95F0C8
MKALIAWWDLTGSGHDAESLRDFVRTEAGNWERIPGLLLKTWVSDPEHHRWGAVMIWESEEAARAADLPRSAAELIGGPCVFREWFEVEALVEGAHGLPALGGLGPALEAAG